MRHFHMTIVAFLVSACSQDPVVPRTDFTEIDTEVQRLMSGEDVKGLAIAVIEDARPVHIATFGYRNVERALPLEKDTVMYGASFTKTAFAYMLLQFVDEDRFDLDKPLHEYLRKAIPSYDDYADLAGDNRWQLLSARHVLTHSTGFANFRWLEDDRKLRFHFTPGDRYAYSGEGFYLLQFTLEEGLGLDVKKEMQTRVFDRFGMSNTSMQWRADFAENLADGYAMDGSFEPHDERSNVSAAGSMDTTIEDQALMWAGIARGEGLSDEARTELVRSQLAITTAHQFPTLWDTSDPRGPGIGLSAGLGLVTFGEGSSKGWFKGGHNDWTGNIAVCQEASRNCVILLSNSVRAELIYPELVTFIQGESGMPWWWEYNHN